MGLIDLGYRDPKYTWCNNRLGNARVWERLDRAFTSDQWLNKYPEASITHLPSFASDHYPIPLALEGKIANINILFKFEKI